MEAVSYLENRRQAMLADNSKSQQGQATSSIKLEALKELTLTLLKEVESLKDTQPHDGKRGLSLHDEVQRFETEMIRWALKRTGGHQRRAAHLLGLKVTTLHAKIKRYRIKINVFAEGEGGDGELPLEGSGEASS